LTVLEVETSLTIRNTGRAILALAVLHAAFLVASLVVIPILAPGARIPNPFGSDEAARTFLLNSAGAIRVSSCLQLMSAVCLAALGATMTGTQRLSKNDSASSLTLAGAIGAAVLLATSALCSWALTSPGTVDPGSAFRTLQFLPFLMGGPGWAGFFALFLAGIVRSGVGLLPKWIVWTGWFLSATSALAIFVMLTISVSVCLPISRFLGFLWLILVAIQWNGKLSLPEKALTK
jgi:hypothetical protein